MIEFIVRDMGFTDFQKAQLLGAFFPIYSISIIPAAAVAKIVGGKATLNVSLFGQALCLMLLPWAWTDTKARLFEGHFHAIHGTRHVVVKQRTATCEDNPAFCAPLSLGQEVSLWLGGSESDR